MPAVDDAVRRIVRAVAGRGRDQVLAGLREIVALRGAPSAQVPLLASAEEKLCAALLWIPEQADEVAEQLPPEAFSDTVAREVYEAVCAVPREVRLSEDFDAMDVGEGLRTPEARALVVRLRQHADCVADEALRYAHEVAAAWGDRP